MSEENESGFVLLKALSPEERRRADYLTVELVGMYQRPRIRNHATSITFTDGSLWSITITEVVAPMFVREEGE